MTNTRVVHMPGSEETPKTYIDPDTAEIIIEQIAALKERTARAEEQLNLLVLDNTDEMA